MLLKNKNPNIFRTAVNLRKDSKCATTNYVRFMSLRYYNCNLRFLIIILIIEYLLIYYDNNYIMMLSIFLPSKQNIS